MQDGVDRRALSAELQTLSPDDRRRRRREFSQWLREASRAAGLLSNLGVFVVGMAVAICGFSFELPPPVLALLPLALVILILGAWLNIHTPPAMPANGAERTPSRSGVPLRAVGRGSSWRCGIR